MYSKNKSHQIVFRLSDEQYNFIKKYCDAWGVSMSEFIRSLIDYNISLVNQNEN